MTTAKEPSTQDELTFSQLIERQKGKLSFQDLADQSRQKDPAGDGIPKGSWGDYGNPAKVVTPEPKRVPLVAATLGVPEMTVWLAIGRSHGLNIDHAYPSLASRISPAVSILGPEEEDLVVNLANRLVYLRQLAHDQPGASVRPLRRVARARTGDGDSVAKPRRG